MTRRIFRVVIDVEVDTEQWDDPGTWDWTELLDAPASLVELDEVASVPTK